MRAKRLSIRRHALQATLSSRATLSKATPKVATHLRDIRSRCVLGVLTILLRLEAHVLDMVSKPLTIWASLLTACLVQGYQGGYPQVKLAWLSQPLLGFMSFLPSHQSFHT